MTTCSTGGEADGPCCQVTGRLWRPLLAQDLGSDRIVGEDDGGKIFTPEEYEAYKKTVLPMRAQNRLFVSWRSPTGIDCKLVGPETLCFCTHRYKQHKTDFKELPKDRPILLPCKVSKCPCKSYHYVPLNGSQPIRCRCKHFADDHCVTGSYNCTKCSNCSGFHSSFTCGCSQPAYAHDTVVETKEERQALGKPVGHDVPYAAMGGLTGFSSLAEGYMRLDESGIGAPSKSFLEAPDDGGSHPFLRAYGPPSSNVKELPEGNNQASSLKTSEEQDMAYFERRYQERLQKEREQKRLPKGPKLPRNQRP
ncbi:protein FAM221A isoform X1 [Dendrobates tinctorius]|uniref:protein FAM221A isoform X1 n=1 Tax=Dendrobates tinctorius TaxID=92724 RepID=UPI003CC961F6